MLLCHYAVRRANLTSEAATRMEGTLWLYWLCSFAPAEMPLERCCMIHQIMSQDTSKISIIGGISSRQNVAMI